MSEPYRRELTALWGVVMQVPLPPQRGRVRRAIFWLAGGLVRRWLAGLVEAALDLRLADQVDQSVLRDLERGV